MPRHSWLRLPRIYIDVPLGTGLAVAMNGKVYHYIVNVRRLGKDDNVLLFNGRDGEWLATVSKITKTNLLLHCRQQTRAQQAALPLALVFACIKRGHQEYMIEKASELGVSDFYPIMTDHSQVSQFNAARLKLIAIEAAEQSERLDVPTFHQPLSLADAIAHLCDENFHLVACLEKGSSLPVFNVMQGLITAKIGIMVGPEGGWSDAEVKILQQASPVSVITLGNLILRADTTAIAALSCWSCLKIALPTSSAT